MDILLAGSVCACLSLEWGPRVKEIADKLVAGVIALAVAAGCQSPTRHSAVPQQQSIAPTQSSASPQQLSSSMSSARPSVGTRPLIDFGRGAGGFPIASDSLPASQQELVAA